MDAAFEEARSSKAPAYGFIPAARSASRRRSSRVPVPAAAPKLIVEAQVRFRPWRR